MIVVLILIVWVAIDIAAERASARTGSQWHCQAFRAWRGGYPMSEPTTSGRITARKTLADGAGR